MKTLICIPCMDMVHTEFMKSLLAMRRPGETKIVISQSSLIYDARNNMARQAVKGGFDRVMWLDSDMSFEPDLMERLSARLDEGCDFVSGLYFTRKNRAFKINHESRASDFGGIFVRVLGSHFQCIFCLQISESCFPFVFI